MKAIAAIKTRLQNFPDANYKIKGNQIIIYPTTENGFTVTLTDNEPRYTVTFSDSWHEEYDDLNQALNCFAFGLSDDCRLKVTLWCKFAHKWTVQERDSDGNWHDCQWVGRYEMGLFFPLFFLKQRMVYRQNRILKSDEVRKQQVG